MTLHKYFKGCLIVTALLLAGGGRSVALPSSSSSAQLLGDAKASLTDRDAKSSSASTEKAIRTLRQQGDYESLMASVEKSRYRVTPQERKLMPGARSEYTASNYAQGLRASFDGTRLEITPDSAGKAPWRWGLRLTGYGYGEALVTPSAPEISVAENRIEYRYNRVRGQEAGLTEWYVNRAQGIEQGFTVPAKPSGGSPGVPLHLAIGVSGDLQGRMVEDGAAIEFVGPPGTPVLRYKDLYATDASGRELPAHLELREGRVSLFVDDSRALYPVTIDPLIFSETKLTASDGFKGHEFGYSVAIDGNTAVVGAPFDNHGGSAYVYVRNRVGWTEQAHLFISDGTAQSFGSSVAIDGNTVVVGARFDAGSAHVYVRFGSFWFLQAHLFASNGSAGDNFGTSVAVSGNALVVGAPFDDTAAGFQAGSAYVYVRTGNSWNLQAHLHASAAAPKNWFGYSVDIDGDTVAVGSPLDDETSSAAPNIGSAYVYRFTGRAWQEEAHLTRRRGGEFGWSVAIAADTLVVGGPDIEVLTEPSTTTGTGSAVVYQRSGSTWSQQAFLLASDGADGDAFGLSVAVDGDVVVVGAPFDVTAAGNNAGSTYVYVRSGADWSQQGHIFASDGTERDFFGHAVALSGATIVVGAFGDNSFDPPPSLAAYVYVPTGLYIPVLVSDVFALASADVLNDGETGALISPLEAALELLDRGNVQPAINQLNAFINQVNALVNARILSPVQAQPLMNEANRIITLLGV